MAAGLNENDQHSTTLAHMWMTTGGLPAWIQYEFDKVYRLEELWVWNSNQMIETFLGFGAKDRHDRVLHRRETWAALEGVSAVREGDRNDDLRHEHYGRFRRRDGQIRQTDDHRQLGRHRAADRPQLRCGSSTSRVQAFEPQPAVAATGVSVETDLDWRPGREATSHTVAIGADGNAVAEDLAPGATVDKHRYTPASLDFATTYYWKVDEMGDTGVFAGDVWSFTTQDFAPIDDFEGYNDDVDAESTIWQAWADGLTTEASGSQVGYDASPFAERSIVHGGKQAMPLIYDNTTSPYYSEAERTFDSPQDWTAHGADSLCVWFQGIGGDTGNSSEGLYLTVKDNSGKSQTVANADAAATVAASWQQWTIPLSEFTCAGVKMTSVKSISIGVGNRTSPDRGRHRQGLHRRPRLWPVGSVDADFLIIA